MAEDQNKKNKGRGFAGMDPDRQREIASEGGKAAHEKGTAHEFTSEEAREAGRKGGENSRGKQNRDEDEMPSAM
ncbi:MAG: KGG domain-containing protein [Candidatus Paceibacterota bacterium]|jgi:hypothetical protein